MSVLKDLVDGLADGQIEIVDLTARLSSDTPIIQLPPMFGQTARFELEEISNYDDRGPGVVLEQLPQRRAHRHPLRRTEPLGHGQGPR